MTAKSEHPSGIDRSFGARPIAGEPDWPESELPRVPVPTGGEPWGWGAVGDAAPALIMYTSGTTGLPKGAVLSRRAFAADLDGLADAWAWTADDTLVHGLPLFHVHGLVLGVLGALRAGSRLIHTGRPLPERYAPEINGARRWLALPGFTFQPLEVAKLGLLVWLAATIAKKGERLDDWEGFAPLLVAPVLMAVLTLLQPDFKGASVIALLTGSMLWIGAVRAKYLLRIGAAVLPLGVLVMVLEPYRMERIRAFFDRGTNELCRIAERANFVTYIDEDGLPVDQKQGACT